VLKVCKFQIRAIHPPLGDFQVPKVLVSNVKGPKTIWVPKNKA
jgi:hypothetical protein